VYELFDEVMDFGYPQFTEAKIMSDYIKTDAHKADVHDVKQSMAVTNAVSWRAEGIKYKARAGAAGRLDGSVCGSPQKRHSGEMATPCGALAAQRWRLNTTGRHLNARSAQPVTPSARVCTRAHRTRTDNARIPAPIPSAHRVAQKNEVFLDVTESMSLLVNSNGQVVHSEVTGALKMRCYLSGMPECKLGLNDKMMMEAQGKAGKGKAVELEDMKFHQCVRLSRFDADRTVSFIPPDGAFDLMTYRLSTAVKPLFWVEAVVEKHGTSRVEYMVKIRSQFKEKSAAQGVVVKLPVSADATNPVIRTNSGSADYAPEQEALLWKIKSFPGGKEFLLRAKFSLPSVAADEDTGAKVRRPPIKVSFEIPYFTVSGIQARGRPGVTPASLSTETRSPPPPGGSR
jgi:AP-1 complex subunit mu